MFTPKPTTGDTNLVRPGPVWHFHPKLYVHVFAWPFKHLHLPGLGGKVEFARFLHDGSEVPLTGSEWETRQLTLQPDEQLLFLPVKKPDVTVPVIELTLK